MTPRTITTKPKRTNAHGYTPNKLFERRNELELTLKDVHLATGASQSAIYRWEHGICAPERRYWVAYAKVLKLRDTAELGSVVYAVP